MCREGSAEILALATISTLKENVGYASFTVILVSFYSLLPNKTTPESREECELVGGFDGAGFGDLGVDTNILIEVAHDVSQDGAIGR